VSLKSSAPLWGLLLLAAAAAPAAAQAPSEAFPSTLDESGLRAWLTSQTDMPPTAVVSIGSNSIIGLKSVVGDPAGPGRYQIQIRAEVVNQRTAAQGGYLSWSADLAIDCAQRRTRALGITNYPMRNLKGEPRVVGGPAAEWVTPSVGTQLYSLLSAVCDLTFRRPLDQQTASAAPPSKAAPAPAKPPAAAPPPKPAVVAQTPPPAAPPKPVAMAQAPPPAPPAAAPKINPPPFPAAPVVTAQASPPPAPPVSSEPSRMQVAVSAPPAQVTEPSPATAAPTFAPPPPQPTPPPAPPPRKTVSKAGVQVAASDSESEAKTLASKARRLMPNGGGLSATAVKANVNGRTVYRAMVSGFSSKGEAAAACQTMKSRGQDCLLRDSF
jgi:hypothetical protein